MNQSIKFYDVVIIGAGAAGLMCALTAGQRGQNVLVLEKSNKVGKKILMSGGGRCNFSNYFVEADNFISENTHFCKSALSRFTQWDFIAMVERHKIEYEERSHSQLFCLRSAKDILDMLLDECELAGVEVRTHCDIKNVSSIERRAKGNSSEHKEQRDKENNSRRYAVKLVQNENAVKVECHSLVVASGGLSIPTLGGSGVGYDIANQFGINLVDRRAGLVPFMFSDKLKPVCERLSGLAVAAEVSCNGQSFSENLLFTHRGISGPVILQISNYWFPGDEIAINFLPDINACQWLVEAKQKHGKTLLRNLLTEKLAKSLVLELQQLWWPEIMATSIAEFSDQKLLEIGNSLNTWIVKPSATEGYRTAEVTLGGIDTDEVSSKTMEANKSRGLYFIGEVLDVSGHLGGFNFQWAWSSGYSAGLFV